MKSLKMEVSIKNYGNLTVVTAYNAISIHNIQSLEKVWEEQLKKNIHILAINFTMVERIDSIGLSHLVKLSRNAIIREIDLIFYGLNKPILDLFKIARLDTFFNILTESEFEEKFLFSH